MQATPSLNKVHTLSNTQQTFLLLQVLAKLSVAVPVFAVHTIKCAWQCLFLAVSDKMLAHETV